MSRRLRRAQSSLADGNAISGNRFLKHVFRISLAWLLDLVRFFRVVQGEPRPDRTGIGPFSRFLAPVVKLVAFGLGSSGRRWQLVGQALLFVLNNFGLVVSILYGVLLAAMITNVVAIGEMIAGWIAAGVAAVTSGLAAAAAWLAANAVVIALTALFALLLLVAQDLYTWWNGGDSLIGRLWRNIMASSQIFETKQ